MSYGVSVAWQVSNFFMSMGLGFLVGFLYSLSLSLILGFGSSKVAYIIFDLIFSVISTLLFFCYTLIYCQGESRIISVIASAIGAVVFHLSVGKFLSKITNRLALAINKIIKLVFLPLKLSFVSLKNMSKTFVCKLKKSYNKHKKKLEKMRNKKDENLKSENGKSRRKISKLSKKKKKEEKNFKSSRQTNKSKANLLDKIHKNSKKSKKVLQNEKNLL